MWHQSSANADEAGNCIRQVLPELGEVVHLPLANPLNSLLPACERNGCPASNTVDGYGEYRGENCIRYVQLNIE